MKKYILGLGLIVACFQFAQAQTTEAGITGGYLNVSPDGNSDGESGFYAGLYTEFNLSNTFKFQPSLLYGKAGDTNLLYLPVMLQYYVANTDLHVQAGPQATYIFDAGENAEFKDKLGLDLSVGLGYDIFYDIFIEARYGFKIAENSGTFRSANFNTFTVGLGIGL